MFAFCNALDSIAFWDGCFDRDGFLCDDVESWLLLNPWDRFREWPFSREGPAFSGCGMVAPRLKAEVGSDESGVARAEVDKYEESPAAAETSQKRPDLSSVPGPGWFATRSSVDLSTLDKAAPTRSSCDKDGSCIIGGNVVKGGIEGRRSVGDSLAVDGRLFSNLLGDTEDDCEKRVVESTLMRLEKRFVEAALDARLDEVEMDHRLRLRKPSLRPPRLLDRECALEGRRRVFLGETESSNSRSLTGSAKFEAEAGAGPGSATGPFEKGS